MAAREFSFALECSDPIVSRDMLRDLVVQVLGHVGCSGDVAGAARAIDSAVADCRAGSDRPLGLMFHAHGGALDISVSSGASQVWHASCRIP